MPDQGKVEYSIIIPSYNSEATIVGCLESLLAQADLSRTEIIVVDSSEDATPRLIEEKFPGVRLFHFDERKGAGLARNIGLEHAEGEVYLFIDSDCIAGPDWYARMIRAHEEHDHAGVGGCVVNGNPQSLVSWAGYFMEFSHFFPRNSVKELVSHIPTCNVSYKKRAFDRNGMFPLNMYPVEDRVFNEKLKSQGESILFDSSIRVRHFHRSTVKDFLRHQKIIGWGSARMRMREEFHTSFLAKSPLLLPLVLPSLFFVRLGLIVSRVLARKPAYFPLWLVASPLYAAGLVSWLFGFTQEMCRRS
jgi:GT2 family glycosyltransferase